MSIETLLTLGLTLALLVAAFVLRVVILSLLRLGLRLTGRDTSWTRPLVADRSASGGAGSDRLRRIRQRRPFWTPETTDALRSNIEGAKTKAGPALRKAGESLAAAGAAVLAMAAAAWRAMVRGADSLERWADRISQRLEPAVRDLTSAARRSTADIGKYLVVAFATVQHLLLLLVGGVRRAWSSARSGNDAHRHTAREPRRPEPTKVIDLDLDLDQDPSDRASASTKSRIRV